MSQDKNLHAYVIGLALGDGNLSKTKRTIRLRIFCDNKYPLLTQRIRDALQELLPQNKVCLIKQKQSCTTVSCYSNEWEALLGWSATKGSKLEQRVCVPVWIKEDPTYAAHCLKGLFETDGSIYRDRGYIMANFVTAIETLANDAMYMLQLLEFKPNMQEIHRGNEHKYTIRISKNTQEFIDLINLHKN